jgi:hypothetical protein
MFKSQSSAFLSCSQDTPYPLQAPHFGISRGLEDRLHRFALGGTQQPIKGTGGEGGILRLSATGRQNLLSGRHV